MSTTRLSKLQKAILKLGLEKQGRFITPTDLKAFYYKFPLRPKGTKLFFDKAEIGPDRYNTASVDICRAFNRLGKKGLVSRKYNQGVTLTPKGIKAAKEITDNG